ncbi:nucleotide exchange factor GrpE [Candidatus Beckwithbacteria bacterium]|nr:nucleotide exchange factor GrpE [Candidatus Beckwithbacteria bacterium]
MAKKDKTAQNPDQIKIAQLEQDLEAMKQKLLRCLADYQNLEKRLEKEKQDWIKFANTDLLLRILPIADDLDRAANFIKDPGLDMVRSNLKTMLAEVGVEEIQAQDQEFDPQCMECVEQTDGPTNQVMSISSKGYVLHGKVLRPAKVVVGIAKK